MRIAVIGPAKDIHLRRWGLALREAGAEVVFVGVEPAPEGLSPYYGVGEPIAAPTWHTFWQRRSLLYQLLRQLRVDVAHPIHLTPSGVWVWLSGFRPYVPFAMGADILEYAYPHLPLVRRWTFQHKEVTLLSSMTDFIRRKLMPPFLRATLHDALLSVGDNYELCFSKKLFEKEKLFLELQAGISTREGDKKGNFSLPVEGRLLLAPRGATLLYQADIILEGFKHYLEAGGNEFALILLTNSYPLHPEVERLSKYLEIHFVKKFFIFRKKLSYTEIMNLWREAAAFISAPVYDGYSYAVAEGRWYGALPIVNAIPGHKEILTHGYDSLFVEPFTPQRLATTLREAEKLLKEHPFWRERNQRWIRRFSDLSANAKRFLQIVEQYLSAYRDKKAWR
ncbi:MAG: hypothetical protein NZ580_04940 [Bacteroidia bacterium]|nr:hypothetical protein [Bacteroidia bacterium]MDW8236115.1 hypothetical protein [Bacteroidia bacterium]